MELSSKPYLLLIKEYVDILKLLFGDKLCSVCLFGSVTRGEIREGSDIDLLIIVKDLPEDVGKRYSMTNKIRWKF